jgi:outer membrane protein TolC
MPRHTLSPAIIAAVLLAPTTVHAEDILTLRGAIEQAVQANHNLRLAKERIAQSQSKVQEATAQALPQVTMTGQFNQQNPVGPVAASGGAAGALPPQFAAFAGTVRVNQLNTTVQATQTVFAGFRVIDGIRMADISVEQTEAGWRQTKAEVSLQTVTNYFAALRAQGQLELAQQSVDQAKAHFDQANKFLKAGTGVKVDVLRAQTQLFQAQQQLSAAVNGRRKAYQGLNLVMGRVIDSPLSLNPVAEVGDVPLDEATAVRRGLESRPDIQQLRSKRTFDELNASVQSRGTWPTVQLVGNYNMRDTQVVLGNNANQQNATVGLQMNWPLFDGLGVAAKTDQARMQVLQDDIQLDQLVQQIRLDVTQSFLDVREASERKLLAEQSLTAAEEALRLARLRYQAGVGTSIEVLDAQVGWQQAKLSLINAVFDVNVSRAKLYRAVGFEMTPEKAQRAGTAVPTAAGEKAGTNG